MGYIYKITNTVTNKCYIGETILDTPEKRWNGHIQTLKRNAGCPALKDAMKKYGVDKFKFEVLIICFDEDVDKYEREYIKKYNSMVPNGYNILPGGKCGGGFKGKKHSEESIKKMVEGVKKFREANPDHFETYRERHQATMKNVDTSSAVKNSEKFKKAKEEGRIGGRAHKDGKLSEETKKKISESVKKYFQENGPNQHNYNYKNHCDIMAKAVGRPVIQYTNDLKFVAQYKSIAEAGRKTNIQKSGIGNSLKLPNRTAGGYIWKYADTPQPAT
jgi:group I intron endonuclease